jgi:hypothetical protein
VITAVEITRTKTVIKTIGHIQKRILTMAINLNLSKAVLDPGFAVGIGSFKDTTAIDKFGYNADVGTTYETVWDGGGTYAYPSSALAMTATSAAGATDNGVEITIEGLDTNYDSLSETVTLSGVGTATTTGEFLRVFRAYVSNGSEPTDDVTIQNGVTTYAQITYPYNQTLMAVYTIPNNYTGYLVAANISIEKQKEVVAKLQYREQNGVFLTKGIVGSFAVPFQRRWVVPQAIPEKTDIEIRAKAGASTSVAAGFEIVLVENKV